jgi:glutaminyl-tRNA synthetase
MAEDPRVEVFKAIGLDPNVAAETINNKKFAATLYQMIEEAGVKAGCSKPVGQALYTLASKVGVDGSPLIRSSRHELWRYVVDQRIKTNAQMTAAAAYFKKKETFVPAEFEAECGVGVVVTPDQIKETIAAALADPQYDVDTQRYRILGRVLGAVNLSLKWADGGVVKTLFDEATLARLGPKTDADNAPVAKAPKQQPAAAGTGAGAAADKKSAAKSPAAAVGGEEAEEDPFTIPPEDALSGRDLEWARNTDEQLARVLAETKGRVITRFPPEPNGYLHLGHAKAMAQNFGVANKYGGYCIMRFDDTNPEAEEQEYIDTILENLSALGHKPWKTTYSSDYFGELYDLAVKLIKKGKAYVCHQSKEDIGRDREVYKKTGVMPASPYRERSVEENLELFEGMRAGKFKENACTLRMKGDLSSPNPNMLDTVFYRIRFTPHPHTGDKWCIYPTYDYTHCIIDSLENITYSMCTLEFEIRRESYFWLLHELDLYKPKVWEYSRLNLTHNVMSKRRLRSLVEDKCVNGWDDPRLLTLNGLRRRGVTPEIINKFIADIGVSRTATMIPCERLDTSARDILNATAPRAMVVVDPLRVVLTNYPADRVETFSAPILPGEEHKGKTRNFSFSRVLYIEREDFMAEPTEGFLRLAPGRTAHLKQSYNITVTGFTTDPETGVVTELQAEVDTTNAVKPFAKLHFVAEPAPGVAPATAEVRVYDKLFLSANPMAVEGDWKADLNPESLVVKTAFLDVETVRAIAGAGEAFQFERVGYFCTDPDSKINEEDRSKSALVFNKICGLKAANVATAAKRAGKAN